MLPDAKARGFRPGRFSFNVKGGRCEACQGDGVIAIEMHFLPNVYVTCEQCKGRRYNRETLEIKYRGKSIADVLDLTVDQALPLLENFPPIANKLRTLQDVGLGYIELGQSATTLSGGEAQRVKLSKELSRRGTGRTLYILDEPTTGLHFEDTHKLLDVLNKLVDQGNTVVIIEHNLDVIKSADYVIDLGPRPWWRGRPNCCAKGTPEDVAPAPRAHRRPRGRPGCPPDGADRSPGTLRRAGARSRRRVPIPPRLPAASAVGAGRAGRCWCRGRRSPLVASVTQERNDIHRALGLDPADRPEGLGRSRGRVNHEPVIGLGVGDEPSDGRVPVAHDDRVPCADLGQVLAEVGLELGDLGAMHDHI